MMDEEEAITIIKKEFSEYKDTLSVYAKKRKKALDLAIKALEQTRWIPVTERLPEEDGMYLINTCVNCIDTCLFYKDDDDEYLWVDYEDSVIAWMPLPQPYLDTY